MKIQSVVLLVCGLIWGSYGTEDYQVSVGCTNQATGLIYIVNPSLNVSVAIETSTQTGAIFDGNTGLAVCYETKAKTGQFVESTGWLASKETIQSYLTGCTSLKSLFESVDHTEVTLSTFTTSIYKSFADVLGYLSSEIAASSQQSSLEMGFGYFLAITDSLCTSLNGNTLLTLIGAEPTQGYGGIVWLTHVFEGLTNTFNIMQIPLEDLIALGVNFKMTDILAETNGVDCLNVILTTIQEHIDLGIAAGATLNDEDTSLNLINAPLGGRSSIGVSGAWSIIASIVHYIKGLGELNDISEHLIVYSLFANEIINIREPVERLITTLNRSNALYGTSVDIKELVTVLTTYLEGDVNIDGINISNIIELLEQGATSCSPAELIVNVMRELESKSPIYESIPELVLSAVKLYNNTNLFIPNTINCSYSNDGNATLSRKRRSLFDSLLSIVETILGNSVDTKSDASETLSNTLGITVTVTDDATDQTSVHGQYLTNDIKAISNAVCQVSEGQWNFDSMLKNCSTQDVYRQIKYWVEIYLGVSVVV